MRLLPIVYKLRQANTVFANRVAGAAEFAMVMSDAYTLTQETAFIIQISEVASDNKFPNSINQSLRERFAVIVALKNDLDQKEVLGIAAFDKLEAIRRQIFKALLGWSMEETLDEIITYGSGRLLDVDRAFLWYQFEFIAATRLTDADGVDNGEGALPYLTTLSTQIVGPNDVTPQEIPSDLLPPDLDTYIQSRPGFSTAFDTGYDTPATQ